jgi:hypothetical protein
LANRLAGDAAYRDRPFSFQWQSPIVLVEALGLPPAPNAAYGATRRMILAEALLGTASGQGVSYSRRKVFYAHGQQYRPRACTYATMLGAVAELVREGWLFEDRVEPNNRGWQSSFWATPDLVGIASALGREPSFEERETILLTDRAGDLVDYLMTRQTQRLRRALQPINAYLKELQIDLPGAVRQGRHLRVGSLLMLPIPGNGLCRMFSEGFACHGRAYGWWQNIPKTVRGNLMIDGKITAEADYRALHAVILYEKRGIKFSGDPYDVDGFDRGLVKLGFNRALNTKTRYAAVFVIARDAGISRTGAAELLAAIEKRHEPISGAFFSGVGLRLMRTDSELILGALKAVNNIGFGALPIHDSLIAPARSIGLAEEKMVEAFETIVGRVNPCQVKIKETKVPHMGEGVGVPPSSLPRAA